MRAGSRRAALTASEPVLRAWRVVSDRRGRHARNTHRAPPRGSLPRSIPIAWTIVFCLMPRASLRAVLCRGIVLQNRPRGIEQGKVLPRHPAGGEMVSRHHTPRCDDGASARIIVHAFGPDQNGEYRRSHVAARDEDPRRPLRSAPATIGAVAVCASMARIAAICPATSEGRRSALNCGGRYGARQSTPWNIADLARDIAAPNQASAGRTRNGRGRASNSRVGGPPGIP